MGLPQITCLPLGLSDHCPLKLRMLPTPGTKTRFRFCDMLTVDPRFPDIIKEVAIQLSPGTLVQHTQFLQQLQRPLKGLHRDKFGDIHKQQILARNELESI